ncbi:MAG TPA: integrin alpha, partial [Isosphaeraceae bacterium]
VFGSRRAGQVGNQITDFLRLLNVQGSTTPTVTTPRNERVGSLGTIGNANQGSPVGAGVEGFPFDGLVFVASQSQSGQVGASVAALGDVNRDGLADFAIGAPGAADATNAPNGAGRVYVIYGARNLPQRTIRPVDLDGPPTDPNGPTILTLVGTPGAGVGRSLAMLGDVITDGQVDLGIGAPFASGNQGAVFVVSGTFLGTPPTTTRPVLATVGQPGGIPGIQITGAQAGDLAGFALSTAGDVDNDASVDFVIGAPGANGGAGSAVLIFGAADLARRFPAFALNQIGPGVTSVPGVVFNGEPGDQAGFSVAAAGDPTIPQPGNRSFNADVFSDFLIGSPGFALGTGRVTAIYGRGRTPLPAGSPTPAFPLTPITLSNAGVASFGTNFLGATPGSRAGFSVSSTLDVDLDGLLEILIGAPGALNGQGQAYLIHGQAGLPATFNLGIVGAASNTRDVAFMDARASGLGAAVSGSLTRPTATIDSDTRGDFLIGAPTSTFFQQAGGSGAVYVLEGAFVLPPAQPGQPGTPADITFQILGVDAVGNFTVSATTPMTLRIFIPSNATLTPPFRPVTDIDLTTLMVNGVPIAGATIAADPIDENVDGIPDAILTIPNRAALNLTAATTTLTVTGRTLAVGTTPARTFTGTATIRVVGAPGTSNP